MDNLDREVKFKRKKEMTDYAKCIVCQKEDPKKVTDNFHDSYSNFVLCLACSIFSYFVFFSDIVKLTV